MKRGINSFGFAAAIALAMLLAAGSNSFAKKPPKAVKLKGSGVAYFATNNFSFDGNAPAELVVGNGKDNIGAFTGQAEVEINPTSSGSCTAPDGTTGETFNVVGAASQVFYAKTTIVAYDTLGAGSECVSLTTGQLSATATYDLVFVNGVNTPSDTVTVTVSGFVSSNGALTGGSGFLGGESFTTSGTITK
jgi:hypothetical protein